MAVDPMRVDERRARARRVMIDASAAVV